MGEAKRRKQLDPNYGKSPSPEEVWARSGSEFDGPADAFKAKLLGDTDFEKACWNAFWDASELFGTTELIGILHANRPGSDADTLTFVGLAEFRRDASRYGIEAAAVKLAQQALGDRQALSFPPTCVIWHDGSPSGDFVSEMLILVDGGNQ